MRRTFRRSRPSSGRSARRNSGNLRYFLDKVLPVAEAADVKLSMHPDDPPLSPIRGVGRIMRSVDNFQRLIDMAPSPPEHNHALPGQFHPHDGGSPGRDPQLRRQDLTSSISVTSGERRRSSRRPGTTPARPTCWPACVPTGTSASTECCGPTTSRPWRATATTNAGYSSFGRLYAIGYIRGLHEAVYRS